MRRLNDIVAFGLEPLCNSLASSKRNQAREHDPAARLCLDHEPTYSQGLHLAFQHAPFIAAIPDRLWYRRRAS